MAMMWLLLLSRPVICDLPSPILLLLLLLLLRPYFEMKAKFYLQLEVRSEPLGWS